MEYVGYLDLTNDKDYQFVYASQLYGTFFCVYARFNADSTLNLPKSAPNEIAISNVTFQIVNYKGAVNLGIVDVKSSSFKNGMEFKLVLKAMDGEIEYPYTVNANLSSGDKISILREVLPINPGANANTLPLQDLEKVFDTETWERNGLVLPIKRTDKHENELEPMAPGHSCLKALFYVK